MAGQNDRQSIREPETEEGKKKEKRKKKKRRKIRKKIRKKGPFKGHPHPPRKIKLTMMQIAVFNNCFNCT